MTANTSYIAKILNLYFLLTKISTVKELSSGLEEYYLKYRSDTVLLINLIWIMCYFEIQAIVHFIYVFSGIICDYETNMIPYSLLTFFACLCTALFISLLKLIYSTNFTYIMWVHNYKFLDQTNSYSRNIHICLPHKC